MRKGYNEEIKRIIRNTPVLYRGKVAITDKAVWREYWESSNTRKEVEKIDGYLVQFRDIYLKHLGENNKILDGGCGLGKWVSYLTGKGLDITGIEWQEEVVAHVKQDHPDLRIQVGDVENLDFPDSSFDAYLSGGVVEHFIEGPQAALLEAKRVLKADALLLVSVPIRTLLSVIPLSLYRLKMRIRPFFRKDPSQQMEFFQYDFSRKEMLSILGLLDFDVVEAIPVDARRYAFTRFWPMLVDKSGKRNLNPIGELIAIILGWINPWVCCSHILCVAKNRKRD